MHEVAVLLAPLICSSNQSSPVLQAQNKQKTGCSPMHSCWYALLEQMLSAGQTESVLKALDGALPGSALLTPQEAQQLVEHSRALPHGGRHDPLPVIMTACINVDATVHLCVTYRMGVVHMGLMHNSRMSSVNMKGRLAVPLCVVCNIGTVDDETLASISFNLNSPQD